MLRILFKPWKSELIQKLRCQLSVPHFSLQCANMGRSLNLPKTSHLLPRTSGNEEYTFYLVYKTFLMSKRQNFGLLKTFFENMHFDSDRHFDSGIPVHLLISKNVLSNSFTYGKIFKCVYNYTTASRNLNIFFYK